MESLVPFILTVTGTITWGLFYFIVGVCYLYFFLRFISGVDNEDDDDDNDGGTFIPVYNTNDN